MAFILSSKTQQRQQQQQPSLSETTNGTAGSSKNMTNNKKKNRFQDGGEENRISSHVYLKPTHSCETLDKDVILRRIRHCKRVNKVRNAVQTLVNASPHGWTGEKVTEADQEVGWLDDAFSAP